jgi:hypothetical protein
MTIRLIRDTMTRSLDQIQKAIDELPKEMYAVWLENTPKRSGNARNKTSLQGKTISARYAYADKLDKGASKKSPKGMSDPTGDFIERYLKQALRK